MINNPIQVLIANDKLQTRDYLTMVLSHEPDMKIVGSVESGSLAVEQALILRPDVVLMEIEMESPRAGIEAIRILTAKTPEIRSVVYTRSTNEEIIFAAFEAGAVDYLIKDSSATETITAIRAAAQDQTAIRPEIAKLIREEFRALRSERATLVATLNIVYKLTPTELELLKLFSEGKTQSQILAMKHIEASTFRTHVGNVLKKFEAVSVRDLAVRLKHLGIFDTFYTENECSS